MHIQSFLRMFICILIFVNVAYEICNLMETYIRCGKIVNQKFFSKTNGVLSSPRCTGRLFPWTPSVFSFSEISRLLNFVKTYKSKPSIVNKLTLLQYVSWLFAFYIPIQCEMMKHLNTDFVTTIGHFITTHVTLSEQGGVVSEPS